MSAMLKSSILTLGQMTDPEDQKAKIFEDVGPMDDGEYDILDDHVLVATYVTPDTMQMKGPDGRLVDFKFTDRKASESQFQGKAALVLKKGPTAWRYLNNGQPYEGIVPDVGDWVVINPSDGREVAIKSTEGREHVMCRCVPALAIRQRVKDPRRIW